MTPNPYDPPASTLDNRPLRERLSRWFVQPLPTRQQHEHPFRWLVDALMGFALVLTGFAVAGVFAQVAQFLDPMDYATGLVIGCYPTAVWMHYCGVDRFTGIGGIGLISALMVFLAFHSGVAGFLMLPLAMLVVAIVLPIEYLCAKLILATLPGSRRNDRTTP